MLRSIVLLASLFLSLSVQAQQHHPHAHPQKLICGYNGNEFQVLQQGVPIASHQVGQHDPALVRMDCGWKVAAGIFGSYFIFFDGTNFKSKYIGLSSGEKRLYVAAGGSAAGAIAGSYFVFASQNTDIESKYIGGSSDEPRLQISAGYDLVVAIVGSYFVAGRPSGVESKYIGGSSDEKRIALSIGHDVAGAVMGSYFVSVLPSGIDSKYVGGSSGDPFAITAEGRLVIASMGSYFVIADGVHSKVDSKYVGKPGNVTIFNNVGYLYTGSSTYKYNLLTGQFE